MIKTLKQLLFCCFFLNSYSFFAQTEVQDYLDLETIRIEKAQETEILIEAFISDNLPNYSLTQSKIDEITDELLNHHDGSENPIIGDELEAVLLKVKKDELRELYFNQHVVEKAKYYVANEVPENLRLTCINGDFEQPILPAHNYTFFSLPGQLTNGCATPSATTGPIIPAFNDFNASASVMTLAGSPLFEPSLNTAERGNIHIPTISPSGGSSCIKLNGSVGGRDVTTMTRNIQIGPNDSSLEYEFSLLLQSAILNGDHIAQWLPFFRVNLIVDGVVVNTRCILAEPNCIFKRSHADGSTVDTDIFYTGWRCDRIDVTNYRGKNAILEFSIGDCRLGGHFGTVYIDNICNYTCPSPAFGALSIDPLNDGCVFDDSYQVCGSFIAPSNSTLSNLGISISQDGVTYTPIASPALQITGSNFCFSLDPNLLATNPNGMTYYFQVTADYVQTCPAGTFNEQNISYASVTFYCCPSALLLFNSPANTISNNSPIAFSYRERKNWIRAFNTITIGNNNPGDGVVYHAGDFIELLPGTIGNQPGFEAFYGSQFSAYIEDCDGLFPYKIGNNGIKDKLAVDSEFNTVDLIKNKITIYPNPTNSFITVSYNNSKFNQVKITSIEGRVVYNQKMETTNNYQLDITDFKSGIYTLSIITVDGTVLTEKLIKN